MTACGPNVKFSNDLESKSKLSQDKLNSFLKSGTLHKKTVSTVTYQGVSYKVSIYSSKSAHNFIEAIPIGTQVPIKFTGGTSKDEIVLETILRQ
jgi:hypothetical protein